MDIVDQPYQVTAFNHIGKHGCLVRVFFPHTKVLLYVGGYV